MYVIEVSGTGTLTEAGKTTSNTVYVPAERFAWTQSYSDVLKEYTINVTRFYDGENNVTPGANLAYALGYIGKSGRFVKIAG